MKFIDNNKKTLCNLENALFHIVVQRKTSNLFI